MTRLACAALVFLALAAGCGGAATTGSEGAEFAPGNAQLFVSISTDVDGEQWQHAEALLGRFPGAGRLVEDALEDLREDGLTWARDVKPALGDRVYLVSLDLRRESLVGYTKPADEAKFRRLVECCDEPGVTREIDGWTVFAETQAEIDAFARARGDETLDDRPAFGEATDDLPDDALATFYVSGDAIRSGIESDPDLRELRRFGLAQGIAGAVTAEEDGVRLRAAVPDIEDEDIQAYEARLPEVLPAGALAYASFGDIEQGLRRALDAAGEASPDFREQRAQAERGLGFSLERDLLPLFAREGAFAVYEGEPLPLVVFALSVEGNEAKARNVLDRLSALAELAEIAEARELTIEGNRAGELRFFTEDFSLFHAVADGRLVLTTTQQGLADVLGDGPKLADDGAFEAAGLPDETTGFLYANLDEGVDAAVELAESQGERVPADVRANLEALTSLVLFGEREGDRLRLSGFLTID